MQHIDPQVMLCIIITQVKHPFDIRLNVNFITIALTALKGSSSLLTIS